MISDRLVVHLERDIAIHNKVKKALPWLAFLSIGLGLAWGFSVGGSSGRASDLSTLALLSFFLLGTTTIFSSTKRMSWSSSLTLLAVTLSVLVFWRPATLFFTSFAPVSFASFLSIGWGEVMCFAYGGGASLTFALGLATSYRFLGFAPTPSVRVVSGMVAASAGLLAQSYFCGGSALGHLVYAHLSQSLAIVALTFWLDSVMARSWERRIQQP